MITIQILPTLAVALKRSYEIGYLVDDIITNLTDMNFCGARNECNESNDFSSISNHSLNRNTVLKVNDVAPIGILGRTSNN